MLQKKTAIYFSTYSWIAIEDIHLLYRVNSMGTHYNAFAMNFSLGRFIHLLKKIL